MISRRAWIAAGFLAALGVTVGIIILTRSSDPQRAMVNDFFEAVCAADGDKLRSMMVPEAAMNFDDPLLASFATGLRGYLGDFQGIRAKNYQSARASDSYSTIQVSCILDFEKGYGHGKVSIVEGKVSFFRLVSPSIPEDWSPPPIDTKLWQDRGREFITAFMEGDAEKAYQMMHPDLQKKAPLERLREETLRAREKAGRLLAVEMVLEEALYPSEKAVLIHYRLKCENLTKDVKLKFYFLGLKGHLGDVITVEGSPTGR